MKNRAKLKAKMLEKLPKHEREAVLEYYARQPEALLCQQRSVLKDSAELPLFAVAAAEKQTDLFG
ncbi:hypothetical protein MCERE19_02231 [Spirosomataceae bacterium]|jgi:hypothetical protein